MAMVQAGMGLGRVVLLIGTGLTGSVLIQNGRLSDLLSGIQEILREKGEGSGSDADAAAASLRETVMQLTREVRQLTSSKVTVFHVDSGKSVVSALMAPAAAAGALGYGYMWWKGISFSSIMYVTKQNMANAVSRMTKELEQVQSSLAAAKRHLTQRIQRVDDKLQQQREVSEQIRDEVTGARLKLNNIGSEMEKIKNLTCGLDGKLDLINTKQNMSLAGVTYLVQFIEKQGGGRLPDRLEEGLQRTIRRFGEQGELQGLGLQMLALESANRVMAGQIHSASINAAKLILP